MNMDDNSKESDSKDSPSQQNNNSIESEENQQNCSTSSNKDNTEDNGTTTKKLRNSGSNGCDIENSIKVVLQDENSKMIKSEKGDNKDADTEMEVGSPEKQTTQLNDSQKTSEEMKSTIDSTNSATAHVVSVSEDKASVSSNSSPKSDTLVPSGNPSSKENNIDFKVIYNKKKYDVSLPPDTDIGALKTHLQTVISIPPAMMKVMIKGLAKDEMTLKRLGVTKGSKVMVIGSSLNDVLQVSTTPKDVPKDLSSPKDGSSSSSSETCKQKQHKKVLDRGKPDDVMPGILGLKESLPTQPLSGMLNKTGGKVRLTFKLDNDQIWIGTKERTEKLPLNSIKNVVSEPIDGHKEYHIVALQLGPTEASRYWIYWVPAQYVDAIKDCILGKWQLF